MGLKLFNENVYAERRIKLKAEVKSGLILIMGNGESACNYDANTYHFRQNSNFLYFFGINHPDLNAIIDIENDKTIIFGHEITIDDIIWMGEVERLSSLAEKVGVKEVQSASAFQSYIIEQKSKGRIIHYLPPYRLEHFTVIQTALSIEKHEAKNKASLSLIKAVINQRAYKTEIELREMTEAVNITRAMHLEAIKSSKVGKYEYEVVGDLLNVCKSLNAQLAYGVIFSVNGEVLHNHHHNNQITDGKLILNDSGAENEMCYAGDITRTFPANGKFSSMQKEIYNIVLEMEKKSIEAIAPGVKYRDIHLCANKILLQRFTEMGLLHGDIDTMLEEGVAGLFMPHGLGHMIGLDVHDMEDLGENYVGYEEGQQRATYLGLKSLRLARSLESGYVLTVEPGIYFIPQLLDKYKSENKFTKFVNYEKLKMYHGFGGIRIEDNILVTNSGYKIIGDYIPKEVEEIEALMS